jgi:hypothetical protein
LSTRRDHAATIRVAQCQRRLLRDSLAPESAKAGTARPTPHCPHACRYVRMRPDQ